LSTPRVLRLRDAPPAGDRVLAILTQTITAPPPGFAVDEIGRIFGGKPWRSSGERDLGDNVGFAADPECRVGMTMIPSDSETDTRSKAPDWNAVNSLPAQSEGRC